MKCMIYALEKMDDEILEITVQHGSELVLIMVVNHRRVIHSNRTR